MFKLLKTDTDALTLFVINPEFKFTKIIFNQKGKNNQWIKIGEFDYIEDKVAYTLNDRNNFLTEIDVGKYSFDFIKDSEKVKTIELPLMGSNVKPWQRGILKTKRQEFIIKAKKINGNRLLIFRALNTKEHCPDCWDDDLRCSNNTSCPTCGGTGFIDKYSEPFFTWGGPYMNQPANPPRGSEEGYLDNDPGAGAGASISLLGDIPLESRDLIYVIDVGELSVVTQVQQTYFNSLIISQNAIMTSLPSESREFKSIYKDLEKAIKEFNGIR